MKKIALSFILASTLAAFADLPDEYLCRAVVQDGKLALVLPLEEIDGAEAAAAYLVWAERTFPDFAGKIVCVWNVDDSFVVKSDGVGLCSAIRKGDHAVGADGKVGFRVEEVLASDDDVKLSFDAAAFKGDYSPLLSTTNLWVGSWADLSARWEKAVADGRVNSVLAEIRQIRNSGRCLDSVPGGKIWGKRLDDFMKARALHPVVRVENKAKRPVLFRLCDGEFEEIGTDGVKTFDMTPEMSDGKNVIAEWAALPADGKTEDGERLCAADFEVKNHFKSWTVDAADFVIEVPENYANGSLKIKDEPSVEIHRELLPRGTRAEDLKVKVKYAGIDGEESVPVSGKSLTGRGFLKLTVKPHKRIEAVKVSCPGFISKTFTAPDACRLCMGETKCITTGAEAKMEREPWPKLKVGVKKGERAFAGPYSLSVVVSNGNSSAELAGVREDGRDGYEFDLQDGNGLALGKLEETEVCVTVRAWAEGADEDTEAAARAIALEITRGSADLYVELPLHVFRPVPCDWAQLKRTGSYVKRLLPDNGQRDTLARICLGKTEGNLENHAKAINGVMEHLKSNADSGHAKCLPSCVCQDNAGGISFANVYADYAEASAREMRLAVIAAAVKKAGHSDSFDAILKELREICE